MRVVDIGPRPERVWEIQVSSLIGRRRLTRILAGIPDVRIVRAPGWLSVFREDIFCSFDYQGQRFVAEAIEEHAYRIGPARAGCVEALRPIRDALRAHPRCWPAR
jgi:hypothetical protein